MAVVALPIDRAQRRVRRSLRDRVPLARRLVLRSPLRFVLGAATASAVVALVVIELSILSGVQRTSSWVGSAGADVWVTVENDKAAFTVLPQGTAERVAALPGVARVVPITRTLFLFQPGPGQKQAVASAWDMSRLHLDVVEGHAPRRPDEVVVDAGFARANRWRVGSRVPFGTLSGYRGTLRVSGMTTGASILVLQFVFVPADSLLVVNSGVPEQAQAAGATQAALTAQADAFETAAARLDEAARQVSLFQKADQLRIAADSLRTGAASARESVAALAVLRERVDPAKANTIAIVAPGRSATSVRGAVELMDGLQAEFAPGYARNIKANSVGPYMPVLEVLVGVALVVGTLVFSLMLSISVADSLGDYGVLVALGMSRRRLRVTVMRQTAFFVVAGVVAGGTAGFFGVALVRRLMPLLPVVVDPVVVGLTTALACLMGFSASFASIRRVDRLDPVAVFHD